MTHLYRYFMLCVPAVVGMQAVTVNAATTFHDPTCVVEQWSNASTSPKVLDINFSDTAWPNTWGDSGSGMQCPEYASGVYVNATLTTPVVGAEGVNYPILFHNCAFATKESYNGYAAATSAFARQYYEGQKACNYNDWKQTGHTYYLEDNIEYNESGKPVKGEAGFVQMCRNASADGVTSLHGWMEIDHLPYVERVQWSWSSTSWGRGIKCDIKVGDGDWTPLVWMGSEKQKKFYTVFSDQGYFMENVIDQHDVSLRWRIWDGDAAYGAGQVQETESGVDWQTIDPLAQRQATRVHKIQIFGDEITADQAAYALANPVESIGEPSDLSGFGFTTGGDATTAAPDAEAPVALYYVNPDGTGDYTTIQAAIDAVADGTRGIIYIAPGLYEENLYAGTKESHNKFISLIGADAATTILSSSVDRGSSHSTNTYLDCAALNVFTERFYAENLTIRNTSGNVGQAEALYTNADAHILKNCRLEGYQDTYKANVGSRGYFTGCTISGATDFIYDGGLEWFEDCKIVCVPGGGYITAPAEASLTLAKTFYPELSTDLFHAGLFFNNCEVTAEEGVAAGAYYLGRPWKENSGAAFMRCRLGAQINSLGWKDWSGAESSASLFEYKNIDATGALVPTAGRASFSHQASDAEVEAYLTPEFLFGKASKVEFDYQTILRGAAAPSNFVLTLSAFSWESDDQAAGYIIYRNGAFEALTREATYTLPEGATSDEYSVAAISRHGVTSATVRVKDAQKVLAFPTAEGFGKFATGGRGGKVVKVTKLTDDGSEGTLRWAFQQYKDEPITIVFEVCGQIELASELRVNRANWTLAGQTAPGEGIAVTRNKVNLGGSQNFIVRNVRFRIGQKNLAGDIQAENALGAENCANFIFDHCSFGWSVEENMNTADSHFLTVQYSIVHEGLYNAGHSKGARGYGSQWGGSPATYHHNLLAHNNSRSARLNGARGEDYVVFMEYVNNVNYNYGKRGGCYGGENTAEISEYNGLNSAHECNFMNNYYKPGPNSDNSKVTFVSSSYARSGATSWAPAKWYVNGNVAEGIASATADNWTAVEVETYKLADIRVDERIVTQTPWYRYTVSPVGTYVPEQYMLYNIESAEEAYKTVVAKAGTVNRDAVERRVAEEAANGTTHYQGSLAAGVIDTESEAEGFFAYDTNYTVPTDTDGDGMPDAWETAHGLNPAEADNNLLNADGYTALEVYLNSLMGEEMDANFGTTGIAKTLVPAQVSYDAAGHTLTVGAEAIGARLEVFATDGRLLSARQIVNAQTSLASFPAGVLLLRISSPKIAPVVLKVCR
jgi:pectin methylesterase-like acyl-CoA thioesterase